MVTRKTRLLSAVAAVLMLVSMLTCFALPVIADGALNPNAPVEWPEAWLEDESNMIAYKNRKKTDTAVDYAITDASDWLAAVCDSNDIAGGAFGTSGDRNNLNGVRLWFTNDIDFADVELDKTTPNKVVMSSYFKNTSTAGGLNNAMIYGQGYAIKNYNMDMTYTVANGNYKAMGIIGTAVNTTIRDLTVDASCSFNYHTIFSEAVDHYLGTLIGWNSGCTLINCHNEANITAYDSDEDAAVKPGTDKQVAGLFFRNVSAFGRVSDGGKMINCTNTGDMTTPEEGYACFMYALGAKDLTVKNCFNTGVFSSAADGKEGFMCTDKEGAAAKLDAENLYTVGTPASAGSVDTEVVALADKVTVLSAGADASGELAYLFNKNYAEYPDVDRLYYSMKNGAMAIGTEFTRTVKIQAFDGETPLGVTYANIGETIDVSALKGESDAAVFVSDSGIVNGTSYTVAEPGADNEVKIMALAANQVYDGFLAEKAAYFAERAPEFFKNEDDEALTAGELQAIQNKLTAGYASQDEINNDLIFLNGFVFDPASAVPILDRAKYPEAVNFAVANLKELEYLSANVAEFGLIDTICFTADIDATGWTADTYTDIDGDVNHLHGLDASLVGKKADGTKAKITGLYIDGQAYDAAKATYTSWLGKYYGAAVKNIAFEGCEVVNAGNYCGLVASYVYNLGLTLENLSFNDCTVTAKNYASGGQGAGFVVGVIYEDYAVVTFKDISITDCTLNRDGENNGSYSNSGFLLGKDYQRNTVIAENIYLNNNTIAKPEVPGSGIMFGEIMDTVTIKNATILNTHMDEASKGVKASLIGALKGHADFQAVATIDNIIIANNSFNVPVIQYTVTAPLVTMTNVYAEATNLTVSGTTDVALDPASAVSGVLTEVSDITSGKAAHALNAADVEKQWAMDGATPVFASETAKAPVEITFKALDAKLKDAEAPVATYTLYTDKDGKLIGLTQDILDAASWDNEAGLADAVFNAEAAIIGYTTPAHDHQLSYTDNGDGTHTVACTFSHTDAELGTFTCDYAEAPVAHELEKKNISDILFTTPYDVHQVVDACKHCTYVADESTAVDCTGTITVDPEQSWDATCAHGGMRVSVCDACDYEFTRIDIPRPHAWGNWTHIEGTDTHKRTCANVADCHVADEVEDCVFENWTVTTLPEVGVAGEKTGTCECGNIKKEPVPALAGIELDSGMAVVGKELEVTVDLKSNTAKLAGVTLEITYDADVLTLKDAENGSWNATFATDFPAATGKTTTKLTMVSAANIEGDGTLLKLIFDVKNDEALANVATEIEVNVAEAKDENLQIVEFEGDKLPVDIRTSMMKGDIDGNQVVNMVDAILLLRYVSGTELPDGMENAITGDIADLTAEGDGADLGDGQIAPEINLNDVIYLLRYLNGWIVEL